MQQNKRDSDKSLEVTPPTSFAVGPPTPPSTDEKPAAKVTDIIRALKRRRDGKGFCYGPWSAIPLSFFEFNQLQNQIDADPVLRGYVNDKVRYGSPPKRCRE